MSQKNATEGNDRAPSEDCDSDDFEDAVRDIQEGIADEAAGRIRSIAEVDEMIRRELGFSL